jgi:hypothetical protein
MIAVILMIFFVLMVIIGTVMGFRALRDIREAGGTLGGAMMATMAAGLLPGAAIVIACSGGLALLSEEIQPRRVGIHSSAWVTVGVFLGIWLSFLMMRGMHRSATGWVPAAEPVASQAPRNPVVGAAIALTTVGAALFLMVLIIPPLHMLNTLGPSIRYAQVDLLILVAGLVCGILGRREVAGRVCAWICGILFVVMLLLVAA